MPVILKVSEITFKCNTKQTNCLTRRGIKQTKLLTLFRKWSTWDHVFPFTEGSELPIVRQLSKIMGTCWTNINTQHREGNMKNFFEHENHPYSLSDRMKLQQGNNSDLLIMLAQKIHQEHPGTFDVNVFDGAGVVHFLSTTNMTTFNEYASDHHETLGDFRKSWRGLGYLRHQHT